MQPEYVCERPSPSTPPRCGVSARFRGAFDFRVWDPDPRHGVAGSVRRQLSPRGQNLEAPRSGPRLPPTKNVSPHGESPAQTSRRHAQGERCEEKGCVPSAPGCRGAVFESVLRMVRMPRGTVADLRTVSISALSGAVGPPAWLARMNGEAVQQQLLHTRDATPERNDKHFTIGSECGQCAVRRGRHASLALRHVASVQRRIRPHRIRQARRFPCGQLWARRRKGIPTRRATPRPTAGGWTCRALGGTRRHLW